MPNSEIIITIPGPLITKGSAAWGGKDRYRLSQEAILEAVRSHADCSQLRSWLDSRTKLALSVQFYLRPQLANPSDLDNLLMALFNPLVEGACGSRPTGKAIPQVNDSLFWQLSASKIVDQDERTCVVIKPILTTTTLTL